MRKELENGSRVSKMKTYLKIEGLRHNITSAVTYKMSFYFDDVMAIFC